MICKNCFISVQNLYFSWNVYIKLLTIFHYLLCKFVLNSSQSCKKLVLLQNCLKLFNVAKFVLISVFSRAIFNVIQFPVSHDRHSFYLFWCTLYTGIRIRDLSNFNSTQRPMCCVPALFVWWRVIEWLQVWRCQPKYQCSKYVQTNDGMLAGFALFVST